MENRKVLVAFSGGADSTTVLYLAIRKFGKANVRPVYFYYGQKHSPGEQQAVNILLGDRGCGLRMHYDRIEFDLSKFGRSVLTTTEPVPSQSENKQASTVVPYRNTMFAVQLACKAVTEGYDVIALGPTWEDLAEYPDCRPEYFKALQKLLRLGDRHHHLEVWTPYVFSHKADVVNEGLQMDVPYEWTWTCYNGIWDHPCRTCDACKEREASFDANGVPDPLLQRLNLV